MDKKNKKTGAPYKSREAGQDTNPNSISSQEWHKRYEPLETKAIKYDSFIDICRVRYDENATFKYGKTEKESLLNWAIEQKKILIFEIRERPGRDQLLSVLQSIAKPWTGCHYATGNIGKLMAIWLKELFWRIINFPPQVGRIDIQHFNKVVTLCKTTYDRFPEQFENIRHACHKECPEDMLQVTLIDSIGMWKPILDEYQMEQLAFLALNRNFVNSKKRNSTITPDNFDIRKSLSGPLAVIFAIFYRESKNIMQSLEKLLREVMKELAIAFSGESSEDVIADFMLILHDDATLDHTTENKKRSLKIMEVLLKFIAPGKYNVNDVWNACITETKAKGHIVIGESSVCPDWFVPVNAIAKTNPRIDCGAIMTPNNLEWCGCTITLDNLHTIITVSGQPISNGLDMGGTNIRISNGNISNPKPNGRDINQDGTISGRGKRSVWNSARRKIDFVEESTPIMKLFKDKPTIICEIYVKLIDGNTVKVRMTGECGFSMETEFKGSSYGKIFIGFKSIRNIGISVEPELDHFFKETTKDTALPAAAQQPLPPPVSAAQMSPAEMITSYMQALTTNE